MRKCWKGFEMPPTGLLARSRWQRGHQEMLSLCPLPPLLPAHLIHFFGQLVCSAHSSTGRTWPPAHHGSPVSSFLLSAGEKLLFLGPKSNFPDRSPWVRGPPLGQSTMACRANYIHNSLDLMQNENMGPLVQKAGKCINSTQKDSSFILQSLDLSQWLLFSIYCHSK